MDHTHFASPQRSTSDQIAKEIAVVVGNPVISGLLNSVSGLLAVLNEHRQILAVNDTLLDMLGLDDPGAALGLRPGEALDCVHADEEPGGCGTSRACATCGAVITMVASMQQNKPVERICALTAQKGGRPIDLALLVRSHPLTIGDFRVLLLFLQDITRQQQRAALERTFFHDMSNMLSGLVGISELLARGKDPEKLGNLIFQAAWRMVREVDIQRCLARNTPYDLKREPVTSEWILQDLSAFFLTHPAAAGKTLVFLPPTFTATFDTDPSLVVRVLSNMIINALEAGDEHDPVKVWCEQDDEGLTFSVWNRQPIPDEVALRVFQRNFSTKEGDGRGFGTYSMKLFGEHILGGKVGFTTSPQAGTTFSLALPG